MNLVPAVAYHFCLNLPEKFTQPEANFLASPVLNLMVTPLALGDDGVGERLCALASWHFERTKRANPRMAMLHVFLLLKREAARRG